MSEPETPFGDALKKLDDLPTERAEIGVVATSNDAGVEGYVSKDIGKPGGWSVAAGGGWWVKTKGYVAVKLGWKGKDSV